MQSARQCANVRSMLPHPRHARAEGLHSPSSLPCTNIKKASCEMSTSLCFTTILNYILFMIFITILHLGCSRIPNRHDCHEPPISKSWTTTSGYLSTAIRWCCTFSEMLTQLSCLGLSYKSTPFRHGSVSLPMFHSHDTWDHNGSGTQLTIDAISPHVHKAAPHRHMSDENEQAGRSDRIGQGLQLLKSNTFFTRFTLQTLTATFD